MAVDESRYFAQFPLQEVIHNKDDGTLLAGGVVSYFSDPQFTTPKDVYELSNIAGDVVFTNIGSVLTLSGIGSFVDPNGNNFIPFLYPWVTDPDTQALIYEPYYITVYSADGILQFTVTDWPPNQYSETNDTTSTALTVNQITNSQFVEKLFSPDAGATTWVLTISSATTVEIAPGWFISASGTGTITLSQLSLQVQTPSNAPYSLQIAVSAGVTGATLYQRIYNSPRLFANNIVSGYFEATGTTAVDLSLSYRTSFTPLTETPIATGSSGTGGVYNAIQGTVEITQTASTDNANGYVEFFVEIPDSVSVSVTSFQVLQVGSLTNTPDFEQTSTPLQKSQLFWYWQPLLDYKQIPSYLVGWDFALNPAQALGDSIAAQAVGANKSYYTWDQTILYQSTNSSITTSRANNGGLNLLMAATGQIAMIQYLDPPMIKDLLNQPMCVNVSAFASVATNAVVSIWYTLDATLPDVSTGTNNSIVLSLNTNGTVNARNGTWVEIPRSNLGTANITIGTSSTPEYNDYPLAGWDLNGTVADLSTITYFAIVISTPSVASGVSLTFGSVSLQSGSIPTRPAPLTASQTLEQCSRYYQKSFPTGTVPAQNSGAGVDSAIGYQIVGPLTANSAGPIIQFPVELRAIPTSGITLYNPFAANAEIWSATSGASWTNTTATTIGTKGFNTVGTTPAASSVGSFTYINWTADARLGVLL